MKITEIIQPIQLLSGSHADTAETGQGCFMNVIAYLNGENQITDQSPCVCYTIRPIAIMLNDLANDQQRQRLLPYVQRAMDTATEDKSTILKRVNAAVVFASTCKEIAAKSAAGYAKYAAGYAAEYAKSAAEYAAKSAAKSAAGYAEYATEYAKYVAEYAAKKQAIFEAGLVFMESACNPPDVYSEAAVNRANELVKTYKQKIEA